jgi:Potential Queuosine, Q, salvage protein family
VALTDDVRAACRSIAEGANHVRIDLDRLSELEPGEPPALDPERHYLEGRPEDVADFMLVLDSINFGSGWFPTLRKRPGMSGYFTVAASLTDFWRSGGGWPADELRALKAVDVAGVLGQEPGDELMTLYADALRSLGRFLAGRRALDLVEEAGGSAERLAAMLAGGMPFFDDVGFWKRAQIVPNDLALAGVAEFHDLDRLTIFADNLVPHVLRVEGVLVYDDALAARIDAGELLPPGEEEEREIRACAVHACELLSSRLGVPARLLDVALWSKGQAPGYKSVPRHRTRTVFY